MHLHFDPAVLILVFSQETENVCPQKDFSKEVHSSFIRNGKNWNSSSIHQ